MRYVALLRGVNVGGKNPLKMTDLKACLERHGFKGVTTYIQSGNVVFDSPLTDPVRVARTLQNALSTAFGYEIPIFVRSQAQLHAVVAKVPRIWRSGSDLRRYIAFVREPLTVKQALREIVPRPGVDFVKAGRAVLYMSTVVSRLKQSGFTKLVGTDIYQSMTIRNYTTCEKILALMRSSGPSAESAARPSQTAAGARGARRSIR